MDLSVSPDLDAFVCYGIVFLLGVVAAVVQVSKRLGSIEGIWLVPRTWLLFGMYVVVPVGLFWLLDRTSAINDTSFFAAVLVGISYERIISGGVGASGGNQGIRAPGEVSQFWTPFLAYADRVERLVRDRSQARQQRLVERVVAEIMQDPARYPELQALASRFAPDPAALRTQLADLDQDPNGVGPNGVLEQKIRLLYAVMLSVPEAHLLMQTKGIIGRKLYWGQVKRINSILVSGMLLVLVVIAAAYAYKRIDPDINKLFVRYYAWRLVKPNTTNVDQARARQNLVGLMRLPTIHEAAARRLAELLRRPGLSIERIELLVQTLTEGRDAPSGTPIVPALLVQGLRSASVDARVRVNDVLKYLAQACKTKFDEGASPWKPSDGDSTATLEDRIAKWQAFWASPCVR